MYSFSGNCEASVSPIFHTDVPVSGLYIPRIGPHIFLQQNIVGRSIVEIYKSLTDT